MSCSPFSPERLLRLVDTNDQQRSHENRREPEGPTTLTDADFERVVAPERLLSTLRERTAFGGPGRGVDGLGPRDLSIAEAGAAFRALSGLIHSGTYRPQPAREVQIPKADGATRTLRIRSILDRTIAGRSSMP